jgi:arsenate reductase (thioredoxin)
MSGKPPISAEPPRILFVCIENSNRSQMAEAFCHILAGARVAACSAGSRPTGVINPRAIAAMAELGYDLSTHASKSVDQVSGMAFDVVVTMGCGDACPNVRARLRKDWQIPDPRLLEPAEFRMVRDQIRQKVSELLDELLTNDTRTHGFSATHR